MNSEYRRGTVLGLTIGEIFILLVFLILLVLLGLASKWEQEEDDWKKKDEEYRTNERILSVWRPTINKFQAPEEIETLVRRAADLERRLDESHGQNTELRRRNDRLSEELEQTKEDLEESRARQSEEDGKPDEEIREIEKNYRKLQEEYKLLSKEYSAVREENVDLHTRIDGLSEEAERAKADLDILRRKGQNPPCWYETVPKGDGTREKAHYIFNIAVHDEYMVVGRREIPPGGADDDNGQLYTKEAEYLGLEDIRYDTPLTDAEMQREMQPIFDLGKGREVRSYSCIFSVKVWDRTSQGAKERWQEAHDGTLERLFGTYVVQDDPWPESP